MMREIIRVVERQILMLEVNKRKKQIYIRGAVGIIATALLVVFGISKMQKKKADTTEGLMYIEQAAAADVSSIEKKIQEIERTEEDEKGEQNYKAIFENAVIMGDSITEGFEEYDILNASSVVAKIGVSVLDLDDQIETVEKLNPQIIFLSYGMNDILTTNGNTNLFVERYEKLLEELKKKVPNARVFINSIFPVQDKVVEEKPEYKALSKYNARLEKLCDKYQLTFIDNTSLVSENDYEPDGIHLKASFYPYWLDHMAEVSALW